LDAVLEDEEDHVENSASLNPVDDEGDDVKLLFSQAAPEASQSFIEPNLKEVQNASTLSPAVKSKLVNDMLRYFVLKGLGKDHIEKKKAVDDVMGEYKKEKIAAVILDEATKKLKALYGWDVMRVPTFMEGR